MPQESFALRRNLHRESIDILTHYLTQAIERLITKEGVLQKKRTELKEKLDSTEEKMSKVKHIKEELTEVEGDE